MADALDDFFARKDRVKKTKGKKPVPAPDDAATGRTAEETVKESRRKEKEKPAVQPIPNNEEDSEWKEVEYEKDYSGLKIQAMTIRDKEEEIREQKLQEATEQFESKRNDPSGPWKTSGTTDAKPVEEAVREEKKPADSEVQKGRYVPPGMRNQAASGPLVAGRLRNMRSSKAPEIENKSEFPSLGASVPEPEVESKPVPTVNSWKDSSLRSAVRTANKFDALSEN